MNTENQKRPQALEPRSPLTVERRRSDESSSWTTSWQMLSALATGFAALSIAILLMYPAVEEAGLISTAIFSLLSVPGRARTPEGDPGNGSTADPTLTRQLEAVSSCDASDDETPAARPSAVFRAIMFTDVVGSTEIINRMGDPAAFELFLRHDRIIRSELMDYEGLEIDRAGDGFVACFRSVPQAVACAVAVQRSLRAFNANAEGEQIHVRIGVGAGRAVLAGDVLFGAAVNEAARICGRAGQDQILATRAVRDRCRSDADRFVPLGPLRLRGFARPVDVAAVVWQYDPPFETEALSLIKTRSDLHGFARLNAAWRRLVVMAATGSVLACGAQSPTGLTVDPSGGLRVEQVESTDAGLGHPKGRDAQAREW